MSAPEFFIIVGVSIVSLLIVAFIFKWVFDIRQMLKYQKCQCQLLLQLAKKMECDPERLESIVAELKSNDYSA